MNRLLLLALALSSIFLSGCASVQPQLAAPPPAIFADAAFKPPSTPISGADLFTLSPDMRAYIHSPAFRSLVRSHGQARGLIEALYRKTDLQLEYESSRTRTAAETYHDRAGNCLSLVIMTAAFAREMDMRVTFRNVDIAEEWSREGSLYMSVGHVNVAIGPRKDMAGYQSGDGMIVVDFLPPKDAEKLMAHELEEHEVVALYMNNRAAEALAEGRIDDAYWWARGAIEADPRGGIAYNTLGVVYSRHGDQALAEQAFKAVLAREPENVATMHNLVPVLAALGRTQEAQALAQRAATIEPVPPFAWFNKGVAAMQAGEFGKAKSLFAREVKRAPYYDEFHFWLALAHLRLGETVKAKEELELAIDTSGRRTNRQLYSAKLSYLRSQVALRKQYD